MYQELRRTCRTFARLKSFFFYDNWGNSRALIGSFLLSIRGQTHEFLSPGQTIATGQRNIVQHCWVQHVACVWPQCCDVLRHVGCCWLKFENGQIWANNIQHVATGWPNAHNMLRPTMLRYVALAGQGFTCIFFFLPTFMKLIASFWILNFDSKGSWKIKKTKT